MIGKPAGASDMIRVQVRNENAFDWLILHHFGECPSPDCPGLVDIDTGVHYCPTVAVFQQP